MAGDLRKTAPLWAALSVAALLAACDNGPSAVAGKSQAAGTQMASAEAPAAPRERANSGVDHRNDPVKLLDGKPEWASSRRYSAEESAHHAFDRNGQAFGAANYEDYVRKAHAFVDSPPAGVLGGPVGFVGSAQSKQELIDRPRGMSYLVVRGRRGGSAMAAAAVNAIASDRE